MIVSFEDPALGDAALELEKLGIPVMIRYLKYFDEIETGARAYSHHKVFHNYQGVPFYKAEYNKNVTVYAIEESGTHRKLSLMFAGRVGTRFTFGRLSWNGYDFDDLRQNVIHPRAQNLFI